ncbi:MAG TPA: DNA adenine methylase [Polyangiaceae bacterium]
MPRRVDQGDATVARPFLKWAGGKRQLLPALLRRAPGRYSVYFEPFVGGGALFFALRPGCAVLADMNERLIRAYRGVRDDVGAVVDRLKTYRYEESYFYEMRERDVDAGSDADMAAWFIYLNRTAYNGLYRVNSRNRFNVPFGRYSKNVLICDEPNLRACSALLANAELVVGDFEAVTAGSREGDFVYLDPPYVPLSETSSFTSYTSGGFGSADQVRLRDVALRMKARGVHVVLSNSSAPFVRELYRQGFETDEVTALRQVNSRADRRGPIQELVIR